MHIVPKQCRNTYKDYWKYFLPPLFQNGFEYWRFSKDSGKNDCKKQDEITHSDSGLTISSKYF